MHTRACTAGLRPKQTCSNIFASAHLQSTKWCLRSNAQGSSADSAASLAVSKCSLIQNTCRSYDEPRSTSQNLCEEVLVGEPDALIGHVRFDERGWETERCRMAQATAPILDSTRAGFRSYWRWKSRRRAGRPIVPLETRKLIREMSIVNPLWGAPRIHGELLKLGIDVGQTSVAKYMVKRRGRPSQGWKTFQPC